jgi:hypothetical protein
MVNVKFSDRVLRVTDISGVSHINEHTGEKQGDSPSFAEVLERTKKNPADKTDDTDLRNVRVDVPTGYGFINYYNGKAQNTFFCIVNPMADMKA